MKKKKIFALMAAALSLAACSTNDIADITNDDADNVVNVASATRAATAAANGNADITTFHLVNTTQRDKYHTKYEADYILDGNTYAIKNGKVMWYNESDAPEDGNIFEAFTPLTTSANLASYSSFVLPTYQASPELLASADWMTAYKQGKKEDGAISLNFEHKYSKLHFNNTATKDDAQNLESEDFSVFSIVTPYYDATAQTVEAIIDPKWRITTTTPIITINTTGNETLSVPIPTDITFEAGKQYNFNLAIGHYALSISSVSVTDWTAVGVSTGKEDELWTDDGGGIDYITFTLEEEQGFKFVQTDEVEPQSVSGFEYSVGNGEWTRIPDEGLNEEVPFGGELGNLRLRGINPKGTNGARTVQFTEEKPVECSGDIRTLIDYRHYKTVDTGSAKFSYLFLNCYYLISAPKLPSTNLAEGCYSFMFYGCESLKNAPALPATTLADYCYSNMFNGCSKLSSVTMLATDVSGIFCLYYWLDGAGTSATTRTLKLKNQSIYNAIIAKEVEFGYLPDIWKSGQATITYEE